MALSQISFSLSILCFCALSVFPHIFLFFPSLLFPGVYLVRGGQGGCSPPFFLCLKKKNWPTVFRAQFFIQLGKEGGLLMFCHNFFILPYLNLLDLPLVPLFCLCACNMTCFTNWYGLHNLHFFPPKVESSCKWGWQFLGNTMCR